MRCELFFNQVSCITHALPRRSTLWRTNKIGRRAHDDDAKRLDWEAQT